MDAVRAHFRDLAAGAVEADDAKLLLLGNGGVGKTQIARWLAGQPYDPDWNSTHGIQIATVPLTGEPSIRLHVWDFGGQDIYHGAHALFLRSPAVLMAVWDAETEQQATHDYKGLSFKNYPLDYWIDVAHYQGHPASPALIVQSKCDRPEQEAVTLPARPEALAALPYRKILQVSAKAKRGYGSLHDALQDAIAWQRDPARAGVALIGAGRLRVQRRLEAMRDAGQAFPSERPQHRLLVKADFDAICQQEGGVSSPDHLLTYLDANGIVFHRPGLFHDRIVLDQAWALEAIYAVFDRAGPLTELCRAGGRFRRWHLAASVWRDFSDAEQKLFVSMMRSCGICFLHRAFRNEPDEDAEYIVADLLSDRTTIAARLPWDDGAPGETAVFRYPLLHDGLMRAVMADVGESAGPDALYWKGGVWAFEAKTGSRLLIEQHMTGPWQGEIRLATQRGQAAALLADLVRRVEQAQSRIGLQPASVERSTIAPPPMAPGPLQISQEKPKMPEWFVSYAWGDDKTDAGREREAIVDRLCAEAEASGTHIIRDKTTLRTGDSIAAFMRRIGAGDRVFVFLSDKYLHSPFCMTELLELWRTSKQDAAALLDRVRVYTLDDADIWRSASRLRIAAYWKKEFDDLEAAVRDNGGLSLPGERDFAAHRRMGEFYRNVGDILAILADIVQPRSFDDLAEYGLQ
ncbi:MAG: COR domain-containing protein [Acetobacteraceae bacterium]